MKLLKKILSRFTLVSLAIIIQLAWLFYVVFRLSAYYFPIAFIFSCVSIVACIFIINRPGNPLVKLAWVVPIMASPLFGGILYLISGGKGPKKKMRRALEASEKHLEPLQAGNAQSGEIAHIDAGGAVPEQSEADGRAIGAVPADYQVGGCNIAGQCRYLEQYGFPLYKNTNANYYADCTEGWKRMLEDLEQAERFIFLEYFIIRPGTMWDAVLEILTRKAAAGVDVRLLYDDFGCVSSLPRKYPEEMAKRGIRCVAFNRYRPVYSVIMNHRDHRKILVTDRGVGYTGGANLSDEYINLWERFGNWKDNFVRLEGEAVRSMTLLFLRMWYAVCPADMQEDASTFLPDPAAMVKIRCPGYVQPYGDSPMDNEILAENVYLNIINQATRYVWICSPYIIVDYEMTRALCLAARRGVDVRLLAPAIPDKKVVFELTKSHFPELIENGVQVYQYTPGFVHSKSFVADDRLAVVGTINMDYRSLTLHFENACLFVDHPMIQDVKADFENTFPISEKVSLSRKKQGFFYRFWLGILRLFAPLM